MFVGDRESATAVPIYRGEGGFSLSLIYHQAAQKLLEDLAKFLGAEVSLPRFPEPISLTAMASEGLMPALFLARHSVELRLKEALETADDLKRYELTVAKQRVLGLTEDDRQAEVAEAIEQVASLAAGLSDQVAPARLRKTHVLSDLWKELERGLGEAARPGGAYSVEASKIASAIQQLQNVDRDGTAFRYRDASKGVHELRVDIRAVLDNLASFRSLIDKIEQWFYIPDEEPQL